MASVSWVHGHSWLSPLASAPVGWPYVSFDHSNICFAKFYQELGNLYDFIITITSVTRTFYVTLWVCGCVLFRRPIPFFAGFPKGLGMKKRVTFLS